MILKVVKSLYFNGYQLPPTTNIRQPSHLTSVLHGKHFVGYDENKMANSESDVTYCSEAEKESFSQIRRSKRLSQKFTPNFRSNGDPTCQRFEEIHQILKSGTFCNGWTNHNWLTLQLEVRSLKKSLTGIHKSKIKFVEKKIDKHLEVNKVSQIKNVPCEPVKSPNILAGMTTEMFTEIPPHQPVNTMLAIQKPNVSFTQVNALDLTKKLVGGEIENTSIQKENQIKTNACQIQSNQRAITPVDCFIDLSDDIIIEENRKNVSLMENVNQATSKKVTQTSKWLKYLPTQQAPNKFHDTAKAPSPLKDKSMSLKHSLAKMFKDNPKSIPITTKSTRTRSPIKAKAIQRSKASSSNSQPNHNFKQDKFPNEPNVSPRSVRSEYVASDSPDFLTDFLKAIEDEDSDCLSLSLKENYKKILGTDSLTDLLGCEKILYSLTERHVGRLAKALNLKNEFLKRTIEQVLVDDSYALFDSDSGSSRIECSQSPTQRLFPSQRSQISK